MVNDATSATAQAGTLVWNDDSNGWTAVTGSRGYADHDVVFAPRPGRPPRDRIVLGQSRERGAARLTWDREDALAVGLGLKAAQAGHRVLFATATEWATRLQTAHSAGRLTEELARPRRYGLLIVEEVGYIPFEQAANLFFQLVSSRYEHALLILTSNLPFARWGDVFEDHVVAAAMIDRIIHQAEVITLKGTGHRLRNTGIDTLPSSRAENTPHTSSVSLPSSDVFCREVGCW